MTRMRGTGDEQWVADVCCWLLTLNRILTRTLESSRNTSLASLSACYLMSQRLLSPHNLSSLTHSSRLCSASSAASTSLSASRATTLTPASISPRAHRRGISSLPHQHHITSSRKTLATSTPLEKVLVPSLFRVCEIEVYARTC